MYNSQIVIHVDRSGSYRINIFDQLGVFGLNKNELSFDTRDY